MARRAECSVYGVRRSVHDGVVRSHKQPDSQRECSGTGQAAEGTWPTSAVLSA